MDTRARAFQHFKKVDARLHEAVLPHKAALPKELAQRRTRAWLFARLARTIMAQQLATGAARTIRERVTAVCGGAITPESIKRASPAKLRAAGLSGAKLKTLLALAEAVSSKHLDLAALRRMPEDEAKSRLTEIWGIGPWSAEMFLMFALGLPDVFSPGDLGLARSIEAIYGLPKNAPREKLLAISLRWAPYRTFAALALWQARDFKILKAKGTKAG